MWGIVKRFHTEWEGEKLRHVINIIFIPMSLSSEMIYWFCLIKVLCSKA